MRTDARFIQMCTPYLKRLHFFVYDISDQVEFERYLNESFGQAWCITNKIDSMGQRAVRVEVAVEEKE